MLDPIIYIKKTKLEIFLLLY